MGLLDKTSGEEVVATRVLDLKEKEQTFEFNGLKGDVLPSILRGFSAPVKLVRDEAGGSEEEDLAFLAASDTDGFNSWEAGQKLCTSLIFQTLEGNQDQSKTSDYVSEAFGRALTNFTFQWVVAKSPAFAPFSFFLGLLKSTCILKSRSPSNWRIVGLIQDLENSLRNQITRLS